MMYIAKADSWFKEGTVVNVVDNCVWPELGFGLFEGITVLDESKIASGQKGNIGDEILDQELCPLDEFNILTIPSG